MKIQKIKDVFGDDCFSSAVFYKYKDSLRFEISESDSRLRQFIVAYGNLKSILDAVFSNDIEVYCCLSLCGANLLSALSQFRELDRGGFSFPAERFVESEINDDEKIVRLMFKIERGECDKLIWMKIAHELGISPSVWLDLHIFSLESEVFAHPYDERGIDIIGKKSKLKSIFDKMHHLLIDYDMDKMEKSFRSGV
ncbi:hypothetical protein CXB49_01645 [Chromobacterium sp. ATCC 53434]|uniref:DUF3885 domain-containing protein n=1 Tax=Chromobacterium sp. (strain ATCC 53434 / SC 14030) TaxID=2059672 RepID=UPI000C78DD85|nr:DUF3885 domain-containing protein [Chromobacterium sp. ATCC 53434]AUH49628.1 hypothetical protein CXB49_01645 [Chromobacterium sp. ATCC 53434]